ncbi:sensor histidine kinase [Micromonospora sp. WMMD1274]|uniref:sensor histidine kinase n=1 Tax=Micromonospora sp. WMMD1274 TaxID=3404116 RepID=UPI003B956BA8
MTVTATAAASAVRSMSGAPPPAAEQPPLAVGLVGLLVAVRLCQVAAWPVAVLTGGTAGLHSMLGASTVYAAQTLAVVGVLAAVWRQRAVPPTVAVLDAAVAVMALLAGGLLTRPGAGTGFSHPALPAAIGAGLTVAFALSARRAAAWYTALAIAYLLGVHGTVSLGLVALSGAAANLLILVGMPVAAGLVVRALRHAEQRARSAAVQADAAEIRAADAEAALTEARLRLAAHTAHVAELAQQHRTLHDTVLPIIDGLVRGAVDAGDPAVRQRLAADAEHLRGLITSAGSTVGLRLVGELAGLARELAPTGLTVHRHITDVPEDVPPDVVRAIAGAVREALNNVIRHSGTSTAWVTVVGLTADDDERDPASLRVTVADRGRGFDPDRVRPRLGLSRSVRERIGEVGGEVRVDSGAGLGTTVEMTWPAGASTPTGS